MADNIMPYVPFLPAVISAIVSFGVAWFTARRSLRTEIDKLRLGVQQKLLEQLVAARLASYPELYAMLSDLPKAASGHISNPILLRELLEKISAWDSKYAILLGPDTTNICYDFRHALAEAANSVPNIGATEAASDEKDRISGLLYKAQLLELGLRSDIGIYGIEVAQAPYALRAPLRNSY